MRLTEERRECVYRVHVCVVCIGQQDKDDDDQLSEFNSIGGDLYL